MSNKAFFTSDIDQVELERILQRIDENLSLRLSLHGQSQLPSGLEANLPALPEMGDLANRLPYLRSMNAPLFVVSGRNLQNILKAALNIPIRVFGYKQRSFNQYLLDTLELIVAQVQGIRQRAEYQERMLLAIEQLRDQVHEYERQVHDRAAQQDEHLTAAHGRLERELQRQQAWLDQITTDQQGQKEWLQQVATNQQGQTEWLQRLADDQQGRNEWLQQVATNQQSQTEWISILERKLTMLALDVREQAGAGDAKTSFDEPLIVDPEQYARKIAEMVDGVRVNLGCGEKPLPGYINIDSRPMPDADIIADIRHLPFDPHTLAEIASFHVVEHFREHQMRRAILPYWNSLLRPDGVLRIVCPNWASMLERLNDGRMLLSDFKLLTFGGQDYEGDDHFAMYTPETIATLLAEAGFVRIEVLAVDRMNGLCPEMEVVAYVAD